MPMLVAAEKVWSQKGVVFVAASLDDKKHTAKDPDS